MHRVLVPLNANLIPTQSTHSGTKMDADSGATMEAHGAAKMEAHS